MMYSIINAKLMGYLDIYAVNARHGMVISSTRMAILE
jgi:hypothetical protein